MKLEEMGLSFYLPNGLKTQMCMAMMGHERFLSGFVPLENA
jgi:hypothetical protein